MLTSEMIKERALALGADLCGIGDIAGFAGTPPQHDPRQVLPSATCVIGLAMRVPKALYEAMDRGIQYYNYTSMGVKFLDEDLSTILLLRMAAMIENAGYDACVQRNASNIRVKGDKGQNPELWDTYELSCARPVGPGKPVPDVMLDFTQAAQVCGLGSPSLRGGVLTPQFGPYVRTVYLITDAPLQCDPPFAENLCDGCMECAKACPGHALSQEGLDSWQCSVYYRGAHESAPYITDDFLKGDPRREAIVQGDARFDAASARAIYPRLDFLPSRVNGYVGCLCARKCDLACHRHLERSGKLWRE